MTQKNPVTLYGNLGADPELRILPGRQITKPVYDPIIDEVVEKEFTTSAREVRTFSIAVTAKDADGQEITRWIRCEDWHRHSRLLAKGDRVKLTGHFRERSYEKDGETKTVREFVIESLKVERRKKPAEVA